MKVEFDPIAKEVDRILFEQYSIFLKNWGKRCEQFCGDRCTCEKRVPLSIREWVTQEVKNKMRV